MAEYYGNHNTSKLNNVDTLQAGEWNNLAGDVNKLVQAVNNNGESIVSTQVDPTDSNKTFVKINDVTVGELTSKGDKGTNVSISGNNNINIEPRPAAGTGEDKNTPGLTNRKGGNIAFKPGDDIEFWAHKRGTNKNDEVSVKIMTEVPKVSDPTKTDEVAAKLQLNTADMVLTSKDKQEDLDVMNITVNRDTDTRGYLKVRAQAIDLRCEEHGGIALLPKGTDGQGNENKIKFEHGGGDGLEFATFNTEKTSIFTDEYRFNRDGVWKMATRSKVVSDKYNSNDETTHYKYVKLNDDFYDNINLYDKVTTTKDIINSSSCLSEANNLNFTGYEYASGDFLDPSVDDVTYRPIVICLLYDIEHRYLEFTNITISDLIYKIREHAGSIYYGYLELSLNDDIFNVNNITFTPLLVNDDDSDFRRFLLKNMVLFYVSVFDDQDNLSNIVQSTSNILNALNESDYCFKMNVSNEDINKGYIDIYSKSFVYNTKVVSIEDLVTLVNYFKTNHEGPWTN